MSACLRESKNDIVMKIKTKNGDWYTVIEVIDGKMFRVQEDYNNLIHISNIIKCVTSEVKTR